MAALNGRKRQMIFIRNGSLRQLFIHTLSVWVVHPSLSLFSTTHGIGNVAATASAADLARHRNGQQYKQRGIKFISSLSYSSNSGIKLSHPLPQPFLPSTHLSILLLNIMLRPPLQRLPQIMLLLRLNLSLPIARNSRHRTTNRTLCSIRDSRSEVVQLTLCFLALAGRILLLAFTLKLLFLVSSCSALYFVYMRGMGTNLRPNQSTNSLLPRAHRLVPSTLLSVRVIARYSISRGRETRTLERGVGSSVFELSLVFLGFSGALVGGVADDGADGGLYGAGDVVEGRLEGGGVVVGHFGCL